MCLNTWMTWAHSRLEPRRRAFWAIGALKNRRARMAMSTWITWQQSRLQGRRRIFYVAGALMNLRVRMAMNSWLVFAQSRAGALRSLTWVVGAITNRRLRLAFSTWSAPLTDDVAMYLRSVLYRAGMAMRHRSVYMCLSTWASWAQNRLEARRRILYVKGALKNRGARTAMNTWKYWRRSRAEGRRHRGRHGWQERRRGDRGR